MNGITTIVHGLKLLISIEITFPAIILPVKRNVKLKGKANSDTMFIGINSHANHLTGPTKLLR